MLNGRKSLQNRATRENGVHRAGAKQCRCHSPKEKLTKGKSPLFAAVFRRISVHLNRTHRQGGLHDFAQPVRFATVAKYESRAPLVDRKRFFAQFSFVGKTINIDDDTYEILRSLKRGSGDSFTKVIRRHIHIPAKTNAELLKHYKDVPPPDVDWEILDRILKQRGRRS